MMAAAHRITQGAVLAGLHSLPAFPKTVLRILDTVDNPDSHISQLADLVAHDPAIAARVMAAAHKAAALRQRAVDDLYTATALVGMQTVREIALYYSLADFCQGMHHPLAGARIWQHSLAVAVCAQELAWHVGAQANMHHGFVAGLLHDIGQLWLLHHDAQASTRCWANAQGQDICFAEAAVFSAHHAEIGAWLLTAWGLPPPIVDAVRHHHAPDAADARQQLSAVVHVAEVLSHALELYAPVHHHGLRLSCHACAALHLSWEDDMRPLFGRITARARYMGTWLA